MVGKGPQVAYIELSRLKLLEIGQDAERVAGVPMLLSFVDGLRDDNLHCPLKDLRPRQTEYQLLSLSCAKCSHNVIY
eukprot:635938-Pleurochrysis_carterae.AAC.3